MDKKKRKKIENAWGIVYSTDESNSKFSYLRKNSKTFRRSKIASAARGNSAGHTAPHARAKTPNTSFGDYEQMFTIKRNEQISSNDIDIIIKPKYKNGIIIDGKLTTKPETVENGKCSIDIPGINVNFVFEAFCDVSKDDVLNSVGDDYRYISKLAMGGYGLVYKGFDIDNEVFIAIKAELEYDGRNLKKEKKIMENVNHENLIKCLDYINNRKRSYLITEFAEGGSLKNRNVNGPRIDENMAKHMFKQIALAVSYLHNEAGIIHRDIKPDNIVLMTTKPYPVAKLIDFGLSFAADDKRERTRRAGTIRYMAPEMLAEKRHYDNKIDVWSVGIALFITLTRTMPYEYDKDTPALAYREKIMTNQLNRHSSAYQTLSTKSKKCLSKCMETDPEKRVTIEALLKDPWLSDSWNLFG